MDMFGEILIYQTEDGLTKINVKFNYYIDTTKNGTSKDEHLDVSTLTINLCTNSGVCNSIIPNIMHHFKKRKIKKGKYKNNDKKKLLTTKNTILFTHICKYNKNATTTTKNPNMRTVPTCFGVVVTMEKDEESMGEQKAFTLKLLF